MKQLFSQTADYVIGRNVIRYLLQNLREETIERVLPNRFGKCMRGDLYLSSGCYPFEKNPLLSNLFGEKTNEGNNFKHTLNAVGYKDIEKIRPYLTLKMLSIKLVRYILSKVQ